MAVAYCEECGKKVALKKSGACSLCGNQIIEAKGGDLSVTQVVGIVVFVGIVALFLMKPDAPRTATSASTQTTSTASATTPKNYLKSDATYAELENEVGCKSKYSDAKKADIFNTRYKGREMIWLGEVVLADANTASLDINNQGTQDLSVTFKYKNAGYDLVKGQRLRVRFVMKSMGGCFLPFSGVEAVGL